MAQGFYTVNDALGLVTEINTQLSERPISPSTVASQVCWYRTSSPSGIGQLTRFTTPFFGNRAKKRSPYEQIGGTLPELATFEARVDEWAPDALFLPRYLQVTDLYGVVKNNGSTLLAQAAIEFETQFADLIGLMPTTIVPYDGKYAADTAHECNPNRPGLKTFSNYKTSFDCNATNINVALDLLDAMPGPDGNLLSMPGDNVVIVSTGAQEKIALEALFGQMAATKVNPADTAGVSISNAALLGRAKVLKLTQLRNYFGGKGWMVARIAGPEHRPFIFTMAQAPQQYLEGVSVDEHSQVVTGIQRMGWKSVHGFNFGWPQLGILCIES